MYRVLNDPALHAWSGSQVSEASSLSDGPPDDASDSAKGIDYPIFDPNMVAELVSDYGTVVSEPDDENPIKMKTTRQMLDEVMHNIQRVPKEVLQSHWQLGSYAHLLQINDTLVRELSAAKVASRAAHERLQQDTQRRLYNMQKGFESKFALGLLNH